MFKLTLITVESCLDGYFNDTTISFGKSPKECWAKMWGRNHGQRINRGGDPRGYGGTPVICCEILEKDGKVIKEVWDGRKSLPRNDLGRRGPGPLALSPYTTRVYDK